MRQLGELVELATRTESLLSPRGANRLHSIADVEGSGVARAFEQRGKSCDGAEAQVIAGQGDIACDTFGSGSKAGCSLALPGRRNEASER